MDIFALKKELEAATSHAQIMALMKRELGKLGMHEWVYFFQIAELFQRPGVLCMNTLRPDWLAHYLSVGHFTADPLFRHFRTSIEPLLWSVEDDWRRYGPETVAFQEDLKEWGYWGGVCLPIQTGSSTHGLVNLVTTSHDEGVMDRAMKVAFLMRYVHGHTLRIWIKQHPGHTSLNVRLTPRETEVLLAVADGLTSKEIGEKLHMAQRTVETHLVTMQTKLQAENRQQALSKAINLGLLHPLIYLDPQITDMTWLVRVT